MTSVRLIGRLAPADGGGEDPLLSLADGELVLEAAHRQVPALLPPPTYRVGRVRDELEARGVRLQVPSGKAGEVHALIARARLGAQPLAPLAGPFVRPATEVERAFLASWLAPDELLLGWLPTATEQDVDSALGPTLAVTMHLVWTDRRAALVGLHPLGDVVQWPLEAPLERTASRRGDRWRSAEVRWQMPRRGGARLRSIGPHLNAPPPDRLRLVVDASKPPTRPAERAAVLCLLRPLAQVDPTAAMELGLLEGDALAPYLDAAESLGSELPSRLESWGLPEGRLRALEDGLRERAGASVAALGLHRRRRERSLASEPPLSEQVDQDIAFAEHLVVVAGASQAQQVLDARLGTLAPLELDDLLPPAQDRPMATDRQGRAQLLEARVRLGLDADAALRELARMRPLVKDTVQRYAHVGGARAGRAVALLDRGGASAEPQGEPAGRTEPLEPEEVELLRHPVGRSSSLLALVQSLVATVEPPDPRLLRQYASALRASAHPRAAAAYAVASRVLGQQAEVFISMGRRSVGVRTYGAGKGMVVLGGDHLDARSERFLHSDAELRFVFGAELAHLRLGHQRATEEEVWAGLRTKGISAAELVVGVVPLLGRFAIGRRLGQVAGALDAGKIDRAIELGKRFAGESKDPRPGESHVAEGRLVAAHRLMQLGADRAGLLLAGDPVPAVRAMIRLGIDPVAAAFTDGAELAPWLLERDGEGNLVREGMAVRVGALVSFWLSREYERLAKP